MIRRTIRSFGYALSGLAYAFRTQPNFRFHVSALLVVCTAGWYLQLSEGEWCCILLACGLVFAGELINTAVESIVDLVSPAYHEKAKIAKDVAAAAVLISALTAVVVGIFIFIPKILCHVA